MKQKIVVNQFAERQLQITQASNFGGFTGSKEELEALIRNGYEDKELLDGFAPFVKELRLHAEDLPKFLAAFREAEPGEKLIVKMEARRPDEAPVPVQYLIGPKKAATAGTLILYSHAQLAEEGEPVTEGSDWEVVSLNLGPNDEPMSPATLWRNYFASRDSFKDDPRAVGGSPHWSDKSDAEFIAELARATAYWQNRGKCVEEI